MNIKRDRRVAEKYHGGFERPSEPNRVVIHGTGGGQDADQIVNWMMKGERSKNYNKGISLFHFIISSDGSIVQLLDLDKWMYHSHSGRQDQNAIGIELCNSSVANQHLYTDKQYESLFWLIFSYIMNSYTIREIAGHDVMKHKYSPRAKKGIECPGNFDWKLLDSELFLKGYTYSNSDQYDHFWGIKRND